MTTFWCEHAVLPGGVRRSVRVVTDRGRILDVRPDAPAEPDDIRLGGVVLPGLANAHSHAFHRALRGRTHDDGGNFWTWRDAMYAVTHRLDPDTYLALARAVFAEMVLAGFTVVGEFHYVHHAAGRPPLRRPERHGQGAGQRGARGRHPDHAARHLLPRRRAHRRRPRRRSTRCSERFSDGTVEAWAERVDPPRRTTTRVRIGAAVHSVRAVPCDDLAVVGDVAARDDRPLHVHLSEQPGENLACEGFYGCSPTELLAGEGLLDAADDRGARHPPVRQRHRAARRGAGRPACFCPTTERDLADGIGPARRLHDAGVRALARLRPARRHRPLRGGARRRDARAAREPRARPLRRRRPARHGRRCNGYRSLGWADGGVIAERPPRRPRGRAARQPAHRRLRRRTACSTRRPPPTSPTSSSRASRSCATAGTASGDVGRLLTDAISAVRR